MRYTRGERHRVHTFPSNVRRNLVHLSRRHFGSHIDFVFAHCRETRLVHPGFHEEGPADEGDDWAEEEGWCFHCEHFFVLLYVFSLFWWIWDGSARLDGGVVKWRGYIDKRFETTLKELP